MDSTLKNLSINGEIAPVSVIIPCYCCHQTIESAVRSVTNQSMQPTELILVEDCSADGGLTLAALDAITQRYEGAIRIVILHLPENRGAGEARNAGWSLASCELVAFLDSDDTWHPKKLEMQVAWMRANLDFGLSCHDSVLCSDNHSTPPFIGPMSQKEILWQSLIYRNNIATSTVILRRDISHRFPSRRRYAEDYHLWLHILIEGVRGMRLFLPLASTYKNEFGAVGLSANLKSMHKGVMLCLSGLHKDQRISNAQYGLAVIFEVLKYWRRVVMVGMKKYLRNM